MPVDEMGRWACESWCQQRPEGASGHVSPSECKDKVSMDCECRSIQRSVAARITNANDVPPKLFARVGLHIASANLHPVASE